MNLKWQSVLLDASSVEIKSLIRALGIVFCKITRPLFLWLKSAKRAFYALTIVKRDWMCEKFQVESAKRAFYALTLKTIVKRDWMCEKFQVQSEHFMLSRLRPLSTVIGCARNKRGHHNRPRNVSDDSREEVRQHISSFPRYVSHVSRTSAPDQIYNCCAQRCRYVPCLRIKV